MAFCKAIAISWEPIYLQFASGREAAAVGQRGLGAGEGSGLPLDVCFLPIHHCLVHCQSLKEISC